MTYSKRTTSGTATSEVKVPKRSCAPPGLAQSNTTSERPPSVAQVFQLRSRPAAHTGQAHNTPTKTAKILFMVNSSAQNHVAAIHVLATELGANDVGTLCYPAIITAVVPSDGQSLAIHDAAIEDTHAPAQHIEHADCNGSPQLLPRNGEPEHRRCQRLKPQCP